MSQISASFRDPSGSVYTDGDAVIRTISASYAPHYEYLLESGLLDHLWDKGWMIPFEEDATPRIPGAWKTLHVQRIPFISFPYEWSFSQLKAAALLTLDIQEAALKRGMILKDASAYNVQFDGVRRIFIDCLSMEKLRQGSPWAAYAQFCRHFVSPLLLMAKVDLRAGFLLRDFIDGIALDMASSMLPMRTRFSPGIQLHVHMHSSMQQRHADTRVSADKARRARVSPKTLSGLAESLRSLINKLTLPGTSTAWGGYYTDTNYSAEAFDAKRCAVEKMLKRLGPESVLDAGANTGAFSRLARTHAQRVIAVDMDPLAVERHYNDLCRDKVDGVLPMIVDLSNPSPALGWHNNERPAFIERCRADVVLALALIHHLHIGNNVPLSMIAKFFAALGRFLILEFVPREDSQVRRMLATRDDIFKDYTLQGLLSSFERYYDCIDRRPIAGSVRTLLLFSRKG